MPGRVQFGGNGSALFMISLLALTLPLLGLYAVGGGGSMAIMHLTRDEATAQPPTWALGVVTPLMLATALGVWVVMFRGINKIIGYYWENVMIEGKRARYTGTAWELFKETFVGAMLLVCTFGIYTPWYWVRMLKWEYSKIDVAGERLEFHGDGASALGVWLVGAILCSLTMYIYFPWYLNNIYEWKWTNTSISGRRFSFQKDPGGIFVLWIVNSILTVCTLGFYKSWADCKYIDWEMKHVG